MNASIACASQVLQDEATASLMKMVLAAGVPAPINDADTAKLKLQVEFIKRGLHALGEWRTQHPSVPRDVVVDAISDLIRAGLAIPAGQV
jgi:hypothetical protein